MIRYSTLHGTKLGGRYFGKTKDFVFVLGPEEGYRVKHMPGLKELLRAKPEGTPNTPNRNIISF